MMGTRFPGPIRVFTIILAVTLSIFVISSVILSLFYEKTAIRFMKKYLDEHLLTELSMEEINFRVLKGFPNATIEITNMVLLSGKDFSNEDFPGSFSDTLLQARSVMLQFDLLKLFGKEYELKKIDITQGKVNLLFDKKNRHNMNIWKASDSTGQNYSINLRSIGLNAIAINCTSIHDHLAILALSEKTNFKGNFSANQVLSGEIKGNLLLATLLLNEKLLAKNATVHLGANLVYSNQRIRFSEGKIQMNKATALLEGQYKGGKDKTIDLTLNMPKFGLGELMSVMPVKDSSLVRDLEFSGQGKLNLTIQGSLSARENLIISSDFELKKCTARNTHTKTTVDNINLKGTVSGTKSSNFHLQLDQILAELGKGELAGNLSLKDLNTLAFTAELNCRLDLKALKDFAGLDSVEQMYGFIQSDFTAAGNLKRLTADSAALGFDFIKSGIFVFEDAGINYKNLPVSFEHISGKATWGKAIRLDTLALRVNETNLLINGELKNLTGYLFKRQLLESNLEVTIDILDISKYLNQPVGSKSSSGYKSLSVFPPEIYLKAHVKAKDFTAGKFKASDLSLSLSALKDSVYIDNFSLKFPEGSITGNALISGNTGNTFSITCNAQPKRIAIQPLFTAFNNFTQHFIVDKNIKGLLTGNIGFYAIWDSTLNIIPKSIKAKGDFEITDGELLQFEPMLKLSKYIDLQELRHIRFKTLKNTIYISDRLVTIPEMAINSTAFNIKAAGQHSFDNVFDYRLKVLLSEVLFNKARKKKKEIDEFMVEESREDQTTIPLMIVGTPDQFDVRLDKKKAFNITHDNIKGSNTKPENKPSSGNFKIEWEEPEKKNQGDKPATKKPDDSDIIIEWEED
jgi:hypothetical protein